MVRRVRSTKSKYWCLTLNNYTEEENASWDAAYKHSDLISYLCYGKEVSDTGTNHLQGYVETTRRVRISSLKTILGRRVHMEARKGTGPQAIVYCRKDGNFKEFGTPTKTVQGSRSDLTEIQGEIKENLPELEIANRHFASWCRYRSSFAAYRALLRPAAHRPTLRVNALWGPPGTGKTRLAWSLYPDLFSVADSTLKWFDGYAGESVILIDDIRPEGLNASFLLKLLDRYKLQVQVKGGFVPLLCLRIILTSNLEPSHWVESEQEPLLRRIHSTHHVVHAIDFSSSTWEAEWRTKLE